MSGVDTRTRQQTTVPVADARPPEQPEVRRRLGGWRATDRYAVLGAAAAAAGTTALLFTQFTPLTGAVGMVVVGYLIFLGCYTLLVSFEENGPAVRDKLASVVVHSLALLVLAALVDVVVYTASRGWRAMAHPNFFTQDLASAGPYQPLTIGGSLHGVVGTLEQISIALAVTVPLGLTTAVFLSEVGGRFARAVRVVVEAMTALPSIVAGLFIYLFLIIIVQLPKSGFAAALALSIMMLPIIVRAADVVLRLVPAALKEASLALGSSQWRTVWHVVLPTARSGLTTAVILGTARGLGETSPVLLTAGYTSNVNADPFSGPQVSLPLLAFQEIRTGIPNLVARGFGTAALLMLLVLALFGLARLAGGRGPGHLSGWQRRRRAAGSVRDAARFAARETGPAPAGSVIEQLMSAGSGQHRAPDGAAGPAERVEER